MELNRGQHPHSWVRAGGEWDMKTQKFIDPGPETWMSPARVYGGASEQERTRWEEKFSSTDDADGFNPIAQTNGLKGGQSYEAHARIKNLERIADANESINEDNAGGGTWVQDVGQVISIEGKVPRSRDKQPLGINGSTSVPKAFQEIHARYGISSENARNARMQEIEKKYGIDKVRVTGYDRVDTTPQSGHHTMAIPSKPEAASKPASKIYENKKNDSYQPPRAAKAF